jgi:hypothetical protein
MMADYVENLKAEVATLRAEQTRLREALQAVTEHMDRAGGDGYGMPECPWCQCQFEQDGDEWPHASDCELVKARGAVSSTPTPEQP